MSIRAAYHGAQPGGGGGGCYFSINYPNFNDGATLPKRSPLGRPWWTANLPYKACNGNS